MDDNWADLDQPFKHALFLRCRNVDAPVALSVCVRK